MQIVLKLLQLSLDRRWVVEGNLCPTSEPGLDEEAPIKSRLQSSQLVRETLANRPRPDNRHFAAQNVEKLWQLVDTGLTQHTPQPGDARIILCRPSRSDVALGVVAHCAKFYTLEWSAIAAQTLLNEEHRSWGVQPNQNCYNQASPCRLRRELLSPQLSQRFVGSSDQLLVQIVGLRCLRRSKFA